MIDFALAVFLVLILPAHQLRKSLRKPVAPAIPRGARYARAIARIAILLVILGIDWWWSARPLAALGLDLPVSPRGQIGLCIAAVLIVAFTVSLWWSIRRKAGEILTAYRKKMEANDFFPRSTAELRGFVLVSVLIGIGWEVLYRGFLLWALSPHVGAVGAVIIASIAYGLAHGYKGRGQLAGSVVAAFAFTIAYAITGSLWWLMLLHTCMGFAGLFGYRLVVAQDDMQATTFAEPGTEPR